MVHSNGLVFLPFLNKSDTNDIQRAMNSSIRAVYNIERFSKDSISALRRRLKIPDIDEIKNYIIQKAAWNQRDKFLNHEFRGLTTRSKKRSELPLPDERGWLGKMVKTILLKAWRDLPSELKLCKLVSSAKEILKRTNFIF